jgi:two-component system CheB/CheR fusion protein
MADSANTPSTPPTAQSIGPSSVDFPVVGIGASAGGLTALQRLFENLPSSNDMAFVVVLHLSPNHASSADAILQRTTRMPVIQVTERVEIRPGHVYVIAPSQKMSMVDGALLVDNLERPRGQHIAIDLFFRTLAEVHRERAVAIVLSGTGADGSAGLSRVKEQGGVTLVQAPEDAEYDGMPMAAIRTGAVDFVLPVVEIPQKLVELWNNARAIEMPPIGDGEVPIAHVTEGQATLDAEDALRGIIATLMRETGHDFRHYKRATVLRRIERRLQVRQVNSLPEYRDLFAADPQESKALLADLLISVTNFFRDREAFEALEREIIPELFKDKSSHDEVRAWSAACATGEEAYSLGMLLADQAAQIEHPPAFQVFASDIDEDAIDLARSGSYPSSIITDVAPARLRQFFTKENDRYRIRKPVRDRILFASHNLLRDPPFSRLDLISCRNLLIYLNRDVQVRVLQMFHFALKPGGYLFLGASESAESVSEFFVAVDKKNRIYRARMGQRALQYASPSTGSFGARVPEAIRSKPAARRPASYAELHQRALAESAPPSVVVDREGNTVHMSQTASQFLRLGGGELSRSLLALVLPELRMELRSALYQAAQNDAPVDCRPVELAIDQAPATIAMTVRPFRDDEGDTDFLLVLFKRVEPALAPVARHLDGAHEVVLGQLEAELQRKRLELQETIENAEISTEELRASNEELQALNEELRSATEELETSKEELQSVNEELVTVNYELKAKVEETGKANDDLNNLIASTDIATIFVDSAMHIKRFTPRATDLFSIIDSDMGRSLLDLSHRLDYDSLADDIGVTFATLRPVEREVRSDNGRYYIVRLLPYRTNEDRIEGAVLNFFDITDRRKAEERARASDERMRMVAESADDYAIITQDQEGRVTSWNTGAQLLFGWSLDEMRGMTTERLFVPEDVAAGAPADELRRAREDGRAEDERWHQRKDGSRFFCSGVTAPLRNGEFLGYVKIARDATARENRAQGREDASYGREAALRDEARDQAARKDEFLSVMSHELRHPLNMININVELLARMPEIRKSAPFMRAATIIRNAVESQAKLIDDLMDISRVRTGKLTMAMGPLALGPVLQGIADVQRADPASRDIDIEVVNLADGVYVLADLVRVEQVLMNLLSNAVKFTPSGGHIEVRLEREENEVRIDVIDDGQGIAPSFLRHVFDMYGQSMSVTTRSKGGLGIGLALVREIVGQHGGRVEAFSEGVGKGARFSVWLPLLDSQAAPRSGSGASAEASLVGLRILVVDDMEEMLQGFTSLLEMSGATVLGATSAQQALAIVEHEAVDLLISDISMPEMDGYALMRRIRANPKLAGLPAIAVTGMRHENDIAQARAAGFSAQLGKPVSIDRLHAIVCELSPGRSE